MINDIKKAVKFDKFKDLSPKSKAYLFTAAGITWIVTLLLCYLSGLWAHANLHDIFSLQ